MLRVLENDRSEKGSMNTQLNAEQRAAVESDAPRRLVVAGPGSGKSFTLIEAVAREAAQHGAGGVIVITFTVAASTELVTRLEARGITGLGACTTLHAFCLKLLREHGMASVNYGFSRADLNIPAQLGVVDDEQKEALALGIARDMGVKLSRTKLAEVLEHPEWCGPVLNPPKEFLVAKEYRSRLKAGGLLDFDMVLEEGRRTALELARRGEWPYRALFVDEVQDSAASDWACYEAFDCERRFYVGDDSQSIYQFRGANPELFVKLALASE